MFGQELAEALKWVIIIVTFFVSLAGAFILVFSYLFLEKKEPGKGSDDQ